MDNKGQSLIIFIILLPIIMIILGYVVDQCYLLYHEKNQKEITSLVCTYAKEAKTENDIRQLALENDKNLSQIIIQQKNDQIEITLEKELPSLFGNLLGIKSYHVKTNMKCMK